MQTRLQVVLLAALLVVGSVTSVDAQTVTRVIDGDTVVVQDIGTVRLIGVDTPETVDPRRPVEAFGKASAAFLRTILVGQTVRLAFDQTRTDRYGRTLAYLFLADGTLVNREIIRRGFGHAYLEFPFTMMEDFRSAQREAMAARVGLWSTYEPTPIEPLPRCQALTQDGAQCKRPVTANSQWCWQHGQ